MKLVIDRATWLRGEEDEDSYLLRKADGKRCCLGFYAKQCGYTDEQMLGCDTPMHLALRTNSTLAGFEILITKSTAYPNGINSNDCRELMRVNDGAKVVNREGRIAEIFATLGVEVEFTGV